MKIPTFDLTFYTNCDFVQQFSGTEFLATNEYFASYKNGDITTNFVISHADNEMTLSLPRSIIDTLTIGSKFSYDVVEKKNGIFLPLFQGTITVQEVVTHGS